MISSERVAKVQSTKGEKGSGRRKQKHAKKPKLSSDEEGDSSPDELELEEEDSDLESRSSGSGSNDEGNISEFSEESSYSEASSAPSRRSKLRLSLPPSPSWLEEKDITHLELPKSADDLTIDRNDLMTAFAVYEVLRHFHQQLRLSPFRFEDFCAALSSEEQCTLLAESHICLLRALMREEDGNSTTFGPHDVRDSINIQMIFLDGMTWPELVRCYIESDKEFLHVLPHVEAENYPFATATDKLKVLQFLCDQFLASNKVREEILSEGAITYDDHCRACHKLGDLLCCETCTAVYHLECVDPPLTEVPEDDWLCSVCKEHRVDGVYDCISDVEKSGMLIRHEPLGYDRHGRKYWHLCRRIIV